MVNILINNAQQLATDANVPFTANIMVPSDLPINNTDLCIILGIFWTTHWKAMHESLMRM